MIKPSIFAGITAGLLFLHGCDRSAEDKSTARPESDPGVQPQVVELRAVGKKFYGPSEIPSGWTTFKLANSSNMIHFAIIDAPPDGITAQELSDDVMQPFQDAMDGMNAGDDEAVNAAFAKFPAWIGGLGRRGGPGFLSPGLIGQTTVYLEPGHYVIECYVKSDGVFHSTSPGAGQLGMLLDLAVTDVPNGAPEPRADAVLTIDNTGLELASGELSAGFNTIQVNFNEQQALPSFVGNDVHVIRVDHPDSIERANAWMDWRDKDGLEDPSPVTFLGGINDLPAGTHGYFTVEFVPGNYAFIAEMPDPLSAGFVLPFVVAAND